jgi:hypothetical protein
MFSPFCDVLFPKKSLRNSHVFRSSLTDSLGVKVKVAKTVIRHLLGDARTLATLAQGASFGATVNVWNLFAESGG